jgi:hypothetical protein
MSEQQTLTIDSVLDNRLRSAKYAKHNKEKIECRRIAREYPLSDSCEFCGSTESLERHHFAGYARPQIFVTACKTCHEWIHKKHESTAKEDRRLTLKQFREFAIKFDRYNEFFINDHQLRNPELYRQIKPIGTYQTKQQYRIGNKTTNKKIKIYDQDSLNLYDINGRVING